MIVLCLGAVGFVVLIVAAWVAVRVREQEVYEFNKEKAVIDTEKSLLTLPGAFGPRGFQFEKAPNGKWRIYTDTATWGMHVILDPELFDEIMSFEQRVEDRYTPDWEKAKLTSVDEPASKPQLAAS
jgi:hypothetical protein